MERPCARAEWESGWTKPTRGWEWTETDWSSDGIDEAVWNAGDSWGNMYCRSKVDTERMIAAAAAAAAGSAAGGRDDAFEAISICPANICGPLLFAAQNGQWVDAIGEMSGASCIIDIY